jgi:hypothetical protein
LAGRGSPDVTEVSDTPGRLKAGRFRDVDPRHRGSGTATIYRLPDDSHALRLESLDVTKGPDLFVVLSPHPDPSTSDEVMSEGYLLLEELKGTKGDQNYALPAEIDPLQFESVVIYCRKFSVLFSVAPLQ